MIALSSLIPVSLGPVLRFKISPTLTYAYFYNAPSHDHTGGLGDIAAAYPDALIYGPELAFIRGYRVDDTNTDILRQHALGKVFALSIHSIICVYLTWDRATQTLFSGGCGRLLEGNSAMLSIVTTINSLPASTVIFRHDTHWGILHLKMLEPENQEVVSYHEDVVNKRNNSQPSLPTSLALERKINPFLRG